MNPTAEVMPRIGRGTGAEGLTGFAQPFRWEAAIDRFQAGGWCWLSTLRPDKRPHVMPCYAAWSATSFVVASNAATRKSRNLDANPACILAKDAGDVHLIVEGTARRVTAADELQRASEAMRRAYGWPTRVAGDELDAEYGAPTSGGPPYRVYEIRPSKAFGLPTTDDALFEPTRWRFR
jgi:hypothetical protein